MPMPRLGGSSRSTPYTPLGLVCVPPSLNPIPPGAAFGRSLAPREIWNIGEASPAHVQNHGTPPENGRPAPSSTIPSQAPSPNFPLYYCTPRPLPLVLSPLVTHSFCLSCQPKCTLRDPSPWLVDSAANTSSILGTPQSFFLLPFPSSARINSLIASGV